MAVNLCDKKVICECADASPFSNLSAEAPDIDTFFSIVHFVGDPPLGVSYTQTECNQVCRSTISQADADLCALRLAQQCVWDSAGSGGEWRRPGTIEHPDGTQVQIFSNQTQVCTVNCPDGSPFTIAVPAGRLLGLTQEQANFNAYNYACKLAEQDQICLAIGQTTGCVNSFFETSIVATGDGLGETNNWSIIAGALPPGLNMSQGDVVGLTNFVSGNPTTVGSYSFTVQVTSPSGESQSKTFTLVIASITTPSALPDGTPGQPYGPVFLTQSGLEAPVIWDVLVGPLPDGLTLDPETGEIAGTPTTPGLYAFTISATGL